MNELSAMLLGNQTFFSVIRSYGLRHNYFILFSLLQIQTKKCLVT